MDRQKEANDIIMYWEMNIAPVPRSTREGWIQYLINPDITIPLISKAVHELANEWNTTKQNPKAQRPNFHDLEERYNRLKNHKAYQEIAQDAEDCNICNNRGFVGIVLGWDVERLRLVPVRKNERKGCYGQLYQKMSPCLCNAGRILNEQFFHYQPDQIKWIVDNCGWGNPTDAFKHWAACMSETFPDMAKYFEPMDEQLARALMQAIQ